MDRQVVYFCYFCSLEWSNCQQVVGGGLKKKVLLGVTLNLIFCVPGLIQGLGTQGESKISSFCF